MINQDQKDKILRFVQESSPEENQKLARFIAGIRMQAPSQGKAEEGKTRGTRDCVVPPEIIDSPGE